MSASQDRPPLATTASWPVRLSRLGPGTRVRSFPEEHPFRGSTPHEDPGRPAATRTEVSLRELFVRGRPGDRSGSHLLCVLRLSRDSGNGRTTPELVHVSPDRLAGHLASTADGVRVLDLHLAEVGTGVVELALVVLRAPRTARAQEVLASLRGLSDCLDYRRDPVGSDAVADTLTTRLESLLTIPGCEVLLGGSVELSGRAGADGVHCLWLGPDTSAQLEEELDVADGRLVRRRIGRRDDLASRGQGIDSRPDSQDHALLRIGPLRARPAAVRSLQELRRRDLLISSEADESGRGEDETHSWSQRAGHARAVRDADRIVRSATSGDHDAAREALQQALQRPETAVELGEQLTSRIRASRDFWAVYDVLEERLTAVPESVPGPGAAAGVVADALLSSMARLLGVDHLPESQDVSPLVTPIVVEIGDDLVPFVDDRHDGGRFLYELIPAMKARIKADLGVAVPGVRARGSGVRDGGCVVLVHEAPRLKTSVRPDAELVVRPWPGGPPGAGHIVTAVHPISGQRGVWLVEPHRESGARESTEPVSVPQLLIHHLETVLRQSLAFYLGPQDVAVLIGDWDAALGGLATAVAPDAAARLRLTWRLQALVRDEVPITDGELLLRTLREAPRSSTPAELHRLLRRALRGQLPGPREGDLLVRLPPSLEAGLGGTRGPLPATESIELQGWLRGTAAERGPLFSVLTREHPSREKVATAAEGLYPLVTTFCEPELETP